MKPEDELKTLIASLGGPTNATEIAESAASAIAAMFGNLTEVAGAQEALRAALAPALLMPPPDATLFTIPAGYAEGLAAMYEGVLALVETYQGVAALAASVASAALGPAIPPMPIAGLAGEAFLRDIIGREAVAAAVAVESLREQARGEHKPSIEVPDELEM